MADTDPIQPDETTNEETSRSASDSSEIETLRARIAELEQSLDQTKDQLLRKAADFENYKRRMESDYASIIKYSNEELVVKLLPILDDFERSIKMSKKLEGTRTNAIDPEESFIKGVELIYSKLRKVLEVQGVSELNVIGTPFDPALHDALLQVARADVPPHTVVEEVEKGYTMHGKVIRHARVVVSADASMIEGSGSSESTPGSSPAQS